MVKNYNEVLYDNETLETPRLILRKFKKTDAADLFEYARADDEETFRWLIWDGLKTPEDALPAIVNVYWARGPGFFAIEVRETGKVIGAIDIRLKPEHEKAGFGYMLNRKFWGNGYMTEALSAILRFCFEKLELNRVESRHYVGNEASGRVMEKAGMKKEGVAIGQEKIKGVFQDLVHYGVTREMWDGVERSKLNASTSL